MKKFNDFVNEGITDGKTLKELEIMLKTYKKFSDTLAGEKIHPRKGLDMVKEIETEIDRRKYPNGKPDITDGKSLEELKAMSNQYAKLLSTQFRYGIVSGLNSTRDILEQIKKKIRNLEADKVDEALVGGSSPTERSIDLRGESGNAYVILAMATSLGKQLAEANPERYDVEEILTKMKSGDYKNLVNTFEEYFGDYVTIYNADVLDESLVSEENSFFRKKDDLSYFRELMSTILISQVGVEKNLDGWEVEIVSPGRLKIKGEENTRAELFVDTPENDIDSNVFTCYNLKSGGEYRVQLSQKEAQDAYDKLIRFGEFTKTHESNIINFDDFKNK